MSLFLTNAKNKEIFISSERSLLATLNIEPRSITSLNFYRSKHDHAIYRDTETIQMTADIDLSCPEYSYSAAAIDTVAVEGFLQANEDVIARIRNGHSASLDSREHDLDEDEDEALEDAEDALEELEEAFNQFIDEGEWMHTDVTILDIEEYWTPEELAAHISLPERTRKALAAVRKAQRTVIDKNYYIVGDPTDMAFDFLENLRDAQKEERRQRKKKAA